MATVSPRIDFDGVKLKQTISGQSFVVSHHSIIGNVVLLKLKAYDSSFKQIGISLCCVIFSQLKGSVRETIELQAGS